MFCDACHNEVETSLVRPVSNVMQRRVVCFYCRCEVPMEQNKRWYFAAPHTSQNLICNYYPSICFQCGHPYVSMNANGVYLCPRGESGEKRRGRWLSDNGRIYLRCLFCAKWTGLDTDKIDGYSGTIDGGVGCHNCEAGGNIALDGWPEYLGERRRIRESLRHPI